MPKKEPSRRFKVGDKIRVNLHRGRIEEAVIRAVTHTTGDVKHQVDVVGREQTSFVEEWQILKD